MVAVHVVSRPPDDWRRLVFEGALLIVTQVDDARPFIEHARGLLDDAFAPAAPPGAQEHYGTDDFTARIGGLRAGFRQDERARALLLPVLDLFGLDPAVTFWDRLNLRVLPDGSQPQHDADLALGAHRDTWSSNIYAQVNWWLPLHPITADRALAFYPRHWSVPAPNSSAGWDLEQLRRQRRTGERTLALVPAPVSPPDPSDALVVVVQPTDLLLFSGAHLHATVPNTSGSPRFSVEMRTVALDDVATGRGAPNIDGAAPRVPWEWFGRVDDGSSLADAIG